MRFEERVYEYEFKLNDTDDNIIGYIRNHRQEIQDMPIKKIAADLYLSPNAIIRLTKKLGYTGFVELKFSLQQEEQVADPVERQEKLFSHLPKGVIRTLKLLDHENIQSFVQGIFAAQKIVFVGLGESIYPCETMGRFLRCFDKPVEYFQQIYDMEYAARHCTEKDLVIVISASGKQVRLLNLVREARERGVFVYCISHAAKNPLNTLCNRHLPFWGECKMVNGYDITDRSGLVVLVQLLCEAFEKTFLSQDRKNHSGLEKGGK